MLVFCQCGSDKVDVARWDNQNRALFHCYTCEQEQWVTGFTLSKFEFAEQLFGAILDQARKHRQLNPADRERLLRERALRRKAAERR